MALLKIEPYYTAVRYTILIYPSTHLHFGLQSAATSRKSSGRAGCLSFPVGDGDGGPKSPPGPSASDLAQSGSNYQVAVRAPARAATPGRSGVELPWTEHITLFGDDPKDARRRRQPTMAVCRGTKCCWSRNGRTSCLRSRSPATTRRRYKRGRCCHRVWNGQRAVRARAIRDEMKISVMKNH